MLQVFATAKMQMFIVRSRSEFLMIFGTGANRGPDFACKGSWDESHVSEETDSASLRRTCWRDYGD